jgi:hypothetical protein
MTRTGAVRWRPPVARGIGAGLAHAAACLAFRIMEGSAAALQPPQVTDKDTPLAYKLFLLLVASSLASALPGEEADSAPEISAGRIKADVAYLASDRLEGRGPGTRGEILATEYLADEFKKAGLKPARHVLSAGPARARRHESEIDAPGAEGRNPTQHSL